MMITTWAMAQILHDEFGKADVLWPDLSEPGKMRWVKKAARIITAINAAEERSDA